MHIAIDARMYGTAQRGIGRYLMKLIEGLEQVDSNNEYTIFLRKENFEEYQPRNPNFKKALQDVPWYGWREQVLFRSSLKIRGRASVGSEARPPDIVHFPHWNVPLLFRRPFVVTIHDLELFSSNRTRENTTRGRIMYWLKHLAFRAVFRHAVLAARAIIVPSNVVREQLLDRYPQVRKKVRVIYEAPTIVGSGVHRYDGAGRGQGSELKPNTYNLTPQRYALYVGAAYPHKNLPRLLEAWEIVHQKLPEYKLMLVGREDWFWKRLKSVYLEARPPGLQRPSLALLQSIVFYGPTTDDELAILYKNAALVVQPSLEEGFSLTPLEALSFGTPVVVSDTPVHHEILKDAALFFNPHNPLAIAEAISTALTNPPSITRLEAHSTTLLSRYSWESHAQQTRDLYETVDKV